MGRKNLYLIYAVKVFLVLIYAQNSEQVIMANLRVCYIWQGESSGSKKSLDSDGFCYYLGQ